MPSTAQPPDLILENARLQFPEFYSHASAKDAALLDALLCLHADDASPQVLAELCEAVRRSDVFANLPNDEKSGIALAIIGS